MTPKPKPDPARILLIIDKIMFILVAALVAFEICVLLWLVLQYQGVVGYYPAFSMVWA